MPIEAINTDRLYRKIAEQLSQLIASGELSPGQRLPAERDLAKQLGVSRPSVREALIALEIEGKVEIRVGSGVYVSPPRPVPVSTREEGEGPFEMLRARRAVEGEVAALAAKEANADDVAELRAAHDELRTLSTANESTEAADRRLHLAIARAAHNAPLYAAVELLWNQGRGELWKLMEAHFQTPALRAATLRDHKAVIDAIAGHRPAAARKAMHAHLDRVDREFTKGWELSKKQHPKSDASRKKALP